ncbi:MAG: ribosome small subunit-dependent GTPase A [Bacteroidota bacterium]
MNKGVIVKSTGKFYHIRAESDGQVHVGTIRGKFKLDGLKLTNPVAVGDEVTYRDVDDESVVITDIAPRKNYVVRQSPRKKHYLHLLASNVDQAILIVTIVEPKLKQGFIDRFLLMTEPYDIPVTIVFNKSDLYDDGDRNIYHYLKKIYENIGYQVLLTSSIKGDGIETLRQHLHEKVSLISGQSGVGKSSLVNRLEPSVNLRTADLSDYSGKGQHTTTFAEMHRLSAGGSIIDTPGIKTLSYNHFEVMDVAHNFKEFFATSKHCKYRDCTHRNEPGCAVKKAIESGEISELRYFNYIQILEEVENQNYWERIKDY